MRSAIQLTDQDIVAELGLNSLDILVNLLRAGGGVMAELTLDWRSTQARTS